MAAARELVRACERCVSVHSKYDDGNNQCLVYIVSAKRQIGKAQLALASSLGREEHDDSNNKIPRIIASTKTIRAALFAAEQVNACGKHYYVVAERSSLHWKKRSRDTRFYEIRF